MKLDIQNYPEYVIIYIDDCPHVINNVDLDYFLARISNKNNYAKYQHTNS
jgi:hypothetical protein